MWTKSQRKARMCWFYSGNPSWQSTPAVDSQGKVTTSLLLLDDQIPLTEICQVYIAGWHVFLRGVHQELGRFSFLTRLSFVIIYVRTIAHFTLNKTRSISYYVNLKSRVNSSMCGKATGWSNRYSSTYTLFSTTYSVSMSPFHIIFLRIFHHHHPQHLR